jgi:hypothetical protein
VITSGLSGLASHHPWWVAAAVAVPAAVAAWAAVGPHLVESRHAPHMFGERRSSGD